MKAILLIGGLGTRLRPFTLKTPKPLLPILNRPFLSYQINFLKSQGIRDIILCTAYKPETVRRLFGNGRSLGLRLSYVHETSPLGTGGAIKNAEPLIKGCTLICNGDIFMDLPVHEFHRFHRKKKALVSIALTRVKDPRAYGLIQTDRDGRIRRFIEKPDWKDVVCDTINAGAYLFEPDVFKLIPPQTVFSVERQLFPTLLRLKRPLYAKTFPGYWLDIGTVE